IFFFKLVKNLPTFILKPYISPLLEKKKILGFFIGRRYNPFFLLSPIRTQDSKWSFGSQTIY
ncbi:MAG: hypothetical protein ACW99L_19080, partial [Promethearchaeota archaeon]